MNTGSIIVRPIISEKSMREAENGKFTFHVAKHARKNVIKKVIEGQFNVSVIDLSTTIVKGKRKRIGARRVEVPMSAWKKAVATLKSGQKIDLFDLTGGTEEAK